MSPDFATDDHTDRLTSLREEIMAWWGSRTFAFPWRTEGYDEWQLLVTEVMLQRTRASAVAAIHADFFTAFPSPSTLANSEVEDVERIMHSLGLRWRARYMPLLAAALIEAGGEVPRTREELESMPGVGPYSAGAFLTLHRNQNSAFIDANVVRLLGRYFGFEWNGETRRKKWLGMLVERLFDHDWEPRDFGYALLDFSREVCGRAPRCIECPVRSTCVLGTSCE